MTPKRPRVRAMKAMKPRHAIRLLTREWKVEWTHGFDRAMHVGAAAIHAMEVLEDSEGDITSIGFMDAVATYRKLTGYKREIARSRAKGGGKS